MDGACLRRDRTWLYGLLVRNHRRANVGQRTAVELAQINSAHGKLIAFTIGLIICIAVAADPQFDRWIKRFTSGPEPINSSTHLIENIPLNKEVFVEFKLENMSDRPIRLAGCRSSCSCLGVGNITGYLDPRSKREFTARLWMSEEGSFHQRLSVFTDSRRQPVVAVDFLGFSKEN